MKIEEFTISLLCGSDKKVVQNQKESLKELEDKYLIHWNNRIDRHPEMYSSYSEMINHTIATSTTEFIVFINDRVKPTVEEVDKLINLLENGFGFVMLYNVGFMGFSKQLVRKIGWWDERFLLGGWEDRDWVWRIKAHNISIYESQESTHDYSWKSDLNKTGGIYSHYIFMKKYDQKSTNVVFKELDELHYEKWNLYLGDEISEISNSWSGWKSSVLNKEYNMVNESGDSSSKILNNRAIINDIIFPKKIYKLFFRLSKYFKS